MTNHNVAIMLHKVLGLISLNFHKTAKCVVFSSVESQCCPRIPQALTWKTLELEHCSDSWSLWF